MQPVILELFCRCILALTQARHHIHTWHKCILSVVFTLSKRNTFNSELHLKYLSLDINATPVYDRSRLTAYFNILFFSVKLRR